MNHSIKLILVLVLLTLASCLFAQRPNRNERRTRQETEMRENRNEREPRNFERRNYSHRWEGLDLTEEQKNAIDTYSTELRNTMDEKRVVLQRIAAERQIATIDRDFDELRRISEQQMSIISEMSQIRINHLERVYDTFTAEQQEKLKNRTTSLREGKRYGGRCCN